LEGPWPLSWSWPGSLVVAESRIDGWLHVVALHPLLLLLHLLLWLWLLHARSALLHWVHWCSANDLFSKFN